MKTKNFLPLLVAACFVLSCKTHAGVIIDNSPTTGQATGERPVMGGQRAFPGAIEHIGSVTPNPKRITTSAKDLPIGQVLAQLVPKGWSGYINDARIKGLTNVSYVGSNRPWPVVLGDVLQNHGLVARLDWQKRELTVAVAAEGVR